MRGSADGSVGNDVYRVSAKWAPLGEVPLFGAEYNFHLEGVVDCPEFIVYFPVLERYRKRTVVVYTRIGRLRHYSRRIRVNGDVPISGLPPHICTAVSQTSAARHRSAVKRR